LPPTVFLIINKYIDGRRPALTAVPEVIPAGVHVLDALANLGREKLAELRKLPGIDAVYAITLVPVLARATAPKSQGFDDTYDFNGLMMCIESRKTKVIKAYKLNPHTGAITVEMTSRTNTHLFVLDAPFGDLLYEGPPIDDIEGIHGVTISAFPEIHQDMIAQNKLRKNS
jgi:hypothetical protein